MVDFLGTLYYSLKIHATVKATFICFVRVSGLYQSSHRTQVSGLQIEGLIERFGCNAARSVYAPIPVLIIILYA